MAGMDSRISTAEPSRSAFSATATTSLVLLVILLGCGDPSPDPETFAVVPVEERTVREPCAHRDPRRQAFFGDLHVHTAISSDAWNYDLEVRPDGAYSFAFGESIWLPPNDDSGRGTREVRLARPLDFMGVTDHAEFFGEGFKRLLFGDQPHLDSRLVEAFAVTDCCSRVR